MKKRREMQRTDWKRIVKRDYVTAPCECQGIQGIASLILISDVTQPLTVRNGDHNVTIVDKGMTWLQIALENQSVWGTAMFDQQDRLLQIYFDITDGNCLEPANNPSFTDLYLDVVLEPDGALYVLDRDELDDALAAGEITAWQHEKAVAEGEKLFRWLEAHWKEAVSFCYEQLTELKGKMENK